MSAYCKHREATAIIAAPVEAVFAFMDVFSKWWEKSSAH